MAPLCSSKQPRLKARKRKRRLIVLVAFLLVVIAAVCGVAYVSQVERLQVRDVSIAGARAVPQGDIRVAVENKLSEKWLSFFSKGNIFLYPQKDIKATLSAAFPRIGDVEVARTSMLAQTIAVTVRERDTFAAWCNGEVCFLTDDQGFIFAERKGEETSYIFRGGLLPQAPPVGQTLLRGRFVEMRGFLELLSREGLSPREVTVMNDTDFSIALESGLVALFSFEHADMNAVRHIALALESEALKGRENELASIDVRFDNKVYYTFKDM